MINIIATSGGWPDQPPWQTIPLALIGLFFMAVIVGICAYAVYGLAGWVSEFVEWLRRRMS